MPYHRSANLAPSFAARLFAAHDNGDHATQQVEMCDRCRREHNARHAAATGEPIVHLGRR